MNAAKNLDLENDSEWVSRQWLNHQVLPRFDFEGIRPAVFSVLLEQMSGLMVKIVD